MPLTEMQRKVKKEELLKLVKVYCLERGFSKTQSLNILHCVVFEIFENIFYEQ